MRNTFTKCERDVTIMKVFLRNNEDNKKHHKYSIDIECVDIFLNDFMKKQIEKLCSIILCSAPEIQIYRYMKEETAIIEFTASHKMKNKFKVTAGTVFKDYINNIKDFNSTIDIISKSIVEKIVYIFTAYSLESY
ncbi:hypothetical protein [Candidatus Clostridium radicumherbarum]|uniref:Uncharacterized protein n=1 Tax=Candidatus Clostridium radicumherbarum TaxID=3381662 RepID=A0ABW8TW67_9CLOT